ncbi:MAG: DUF2442 domain-containing protein [Chlorobium sp.]
MLCNVVAFAPLHDGHLFIELNNGETGVFDMRPYMRSNYFASLKKPEYFNQAFLEYGVISWPEGQDISPDTMRLEMILQSCPDGIKLHQNNAHNSSQGCLTQ